MAYEEHSVHHAQEFENRFWTVFAMLLSTALFFARDSPIAFGLWSPNLGIVGVILSGYAMLVWDRHIHRLAMTRQHRHSRKSGTITQSLVNLRDLGIPVEAHLAKINECLKKIDQLLIPSTINNFINLRYVQGQEREIITIFHECDARALNFLIGNVKLGLLFYKIKDHRNFQAKHRTELIQLLAVERLPILTVMSRVILLHSLQLLKLRANPRAEYWVQQVLLHTHQDDLSELKTLTDTKGDYFSMTKLVYDDLRSESIRQDILHHIRREAAIQQTYWQMGARTSRRREKAPYVSSWRKILSDVDDTLYCSGGMYPAGVDRRFARKTVYPGVLAFYRELDLGADGPEEWPDGRVGNLVFLSARPHVYKDMSEKLNFAKFEKLRKDREDGRKGLHTTPSLLAGDLASGGSYLVTNDFEPLALKKFDNFRQYVNLYPEYQHVFVCDNGQGDVRAAELMFESFPYEFSSTYVHIVQDVNTTYGYDLERWSRKEFKPVFFRTYPEAALHAASQNPPLISKPGLRRICEDSVKDFNQIRHFPSEASKAGRRQELNQAIWVANSFLEWHNEPTVALIKGEQRWKEGEWVSTPYGLGVIRGYDQVWDLYDVEVDWRSLEEQVKDYTEIIAAEKAKKPAKALETVVEADEQNEEQQPICSGIQQGGESSAEQPDQPTELTHDVKLSPESVKPAIEAPTLRSSIRARVTGQAVSKHVPPTLPKIDRPSTLFSFFGGDTPKKDFIKKPTFEVGDECATPYGLARVTELRKDQRTVVVDMIDWHAFAYLQRDQISQPSRSLLRTFLRQIGDKPQFPHVKGTPIVTPFGKGTVQRPVPVSASGRSIKRKRYATIGISLDSWKLADGSNPVLYCTAVNAKTWKEKPGSSSSILTSWSTAFVTSSRSLLNPFLTQPKATQPPTPKLFEQYFQVGAVVTTPYGKGRVLKFRPTDGFYITVLASWSLADGRNPRVFVRGVDLRSFVAPGCHEGYPVLTSIGLTGSLASVEPSTSVHIVTIPSAGMVCYLQPDSVIQPLKAAVGEDVLTAFGEGKVTRFLHDTDLYEISLSWKAKLYAKADTFDRVGDGIQDRDGVFGVSWLFRMFFSSSSPAGEDTSAAGTRSRSNSLVSGMSIVSGISQKSKS